MDESCRILVPIYANTKAYESKIEAIYNKYMKGFSGQIAITGGAVRDTILNKPIRDIDIYILEYALPDYITYLDGLEITEDTFYDGVKATEEDKEMYCHLPIKRRIVGRYKGDLVDILCMRNNSYVTAQSISALHTVGISQCGIDKDGSIYTSELFHKDVKDKMITMTRLDWGHAKSMKYFMKLWDKYQWPLRIGVKQDDSFSVTLSHPVTLGGSGGSGSMPVAMMHGVSFKGYTHPSVFTGVAASSHCAVVGDCTGGIK